MSVISKISVGNSNTKYDLPENDGSVISISVLIHRNCYVQIHNYS